MNVIARLILDKLVLIFSFYKVVFSQQVTIKKFFMKGLFFDFRKIFVEISFNPILYLLLLVYQILLIEIFMNISPLIYN